MQKLLFALLVGIALLGASFVGIGPGIASADHTEVIETCVASGLPGFTSFGVTYGTFASDINARMVAHYFRLMSLGIMSTGVESGDVLRLAFNLAVRDLGLEPCDPSLWQPFDPFGEH
jgi:hypothetical protein